MSNGYLLDIALILLSTKVFGLITKKFNLPQVVGALIAGVLMGPAVFNIVQESDFISKLSELGVIIIMFNAGLESNIDKLRKSGKDLIIIASLGVLVPLVGGFTIAYLYDSSSILGDVFIGAILTATSVSITVETLREMGKIQTHAANAIIGAAIVDDVLGILVLTVITGVSDPSVSIVRVLLKICAFFVFAIIAGMIIYKFFQKWTGKYDGDKRRFVIVAFVICLLFAYIADRFFGVADITGAFIAGLILSKDKVSSFLDRRFSILSYMLLTPIFFANIGINISIPEMSGSIVLLTVSLVLTAILAKIIGCGLGAKLCGYTNTEVVQIGVGMVPRGEVALVIASKGLKSGVMNSIFLTPVVIMIVCCAILSPILLKFAFSKKDTLNKERNIA